MLTGPIFSKVMKQTAINLIRDLPISISDAARLVLELAELLASEVTGLSRIELLNLMREVQAKGVQALKKERGTVSFEIAARASLEARKDRRPTTLRDLRHFIGCFLRVEGIAECPLRAFGTAECRTLLAKAFPNSPSSYRKGRAILSSIFSFGIRHEWCDKNPVLGIETPRIIEKPIKPLTLDEVRRLEQAATRPEHQEMQLSLKLMLYCGLRPAEVTRIDPHRDIVGDELIVRPQTSKTGGGRVVPLRKLGAFIRRHQDKLTIPRQWEERWRRLRKCAQFFTWQADACRHTFATYHAGYFRDIAALQSEMGHSSPRLLHTRYVSPISHSVAEKYWKT